MNTATASQITFITDLQADKAWKAELDWTDTDASALKAAQRGMAARVSAARTTGLDATYDAYEATRTAMIAAKGTDGYDAARDAHTAESDRLAQAEVDAAIARRGRAIAALTIDPTGLTQAEASEVIDLLKGL